MVKGGDQGKGRIGYLAKVDVRETGHVIKRGIKTAEDTQGLIKEKEQQQPKIWLFCVIALVRHSSLFCGFLFLFLFCFGASFVFLVCGVGLGGFCLPLLLCCL